jgi:hypothetical protein
MAVRIDPTDPAKLTPEQRLDEITAILGEGVRRLRARAALPPPHLPTSDPL